MVQKAIRDNASTPTITAELILWLEKVYPDSIARMSYATIEQWHMAVGQQQVIQKLKSEFHRQNHTEDPEDEE